MPTAVYRTFTARKSITVAGFPDRNLSTIIMKGDKLICNLIPDKEGKYAISSPMKPTFCKVTKSELISVFPECIMLIDDEQEIP